MLSTETKGTPAILDINPKKILWTHFLAKKTLRKLGEKLRLRTLYTTTFQKSRDYINFLS
jgi:hypothetical protein